MSTSQHPVTSHARQYTTIADTRSLSHPAGRHPTLAVLEDRLHEVTVGAVAAMLETATRPAAAVALPTVLWMRGPADHPKSRRGLLPHPISWSTQPLLVRAAGTELEAAWSVRTWGRRLAGTVRIIVADGEPATRTITSLDALDLLLGDARPRVVEAMRAQHVDRALRRATQDGPHARWFLHEFLEPWLRRSLHAAHRAVSAELRVVRVIDDIALEDLFTELLLGRGDKPGLVDKTINRLATPGLPRPNVDAARYIATTFRRDAELALRRRIDDPRWVGPALRRFAANHPELAGADLVDAYNASSCTAERIGLDRAMRALHPAVQPTTVHVAIESIATQSAPHPDDVFLRPLSPTGATNDTTPRHRVRSTALSA